MKNSVLRRGRAVVGVVGVAIASLVLAGAVVGCGGGQQVPQAMKQVQPDRLEITRKNPLHQDIVKMDQPFVVQDTAQVGKVYTSLLAIHTPLPSGAYNCPADFGVSYHLTFLKGTQAVLEADVNGSGCRVVTIGQDKKWYGVSEDADAFFEVLSKVMGMTEQQFAGVPPRGRD